MAADERQHADGDVAPEGTALDQYPSGEYHKANLDKMDEQARDLGRYIERNEALERVLKAKNDELQVLKFKHAELELSASDLLQRSQNATHDAMFGAMLLEAANKKVVERDNTINLLTDELTRLRKLVAGQIDQ